MLTLCSPQPLHGGGPSAAPPRGEREDPPGAEGTNVSLSSSHTRTSLCSEPFFVSGVWIQSRPADALLLLLLLLRFGRRSSSSRGAGPSPDTEGGRRLQPAVGVQVLLQRGQRRTGERTLVLRQGLMLTLSTADAVMIQVQGCRWSSTSTISQSDRLSLLPSQL